jgi:1-deoxy-D-xylulose-5-phosphate synthase
MFERLETIQTPADLRQLTEENLQPLVSELREFILQSVSKTGGHLSSNLGTVELTVALHYVFNTPEDRLIWDVGHQSYAHKILTGRKDQMSTLRQLGGISGFPRREESEYDCFGTAHSSTSISAAIGMAIASQQQGIQRHCLAVIGDGAMSAGMAFEAMNNVSEYPDLPLIVILNDNEMSISPPVGAINRYLARLISSRWVAKTREQAKKVLSHTPRMLNFARRLEEHTKGLIVPATLFEEFGFNYIGPIDGHDLDSLIPTLRNLKALKGPQFLHVITKKGQGYKLAEKDPILYHGPSKFDPSVGILPPLTKSKPTYSQIFGDWLCQKARVDQQLVAITPAMREGSGMVEFSEKFPERYFDVGIAEQHAITFAAGMACENLKPVVAIYSTFLQRAYDQLIHDAALQNLDITLAVDRAGLVGADGATHAGNYDIAFSRCLPQVVIATPSNEKETWLLLNTAYAHQGVAIVRYPRGSGTGIIADAKEETVPIGKAVVRRYGKKVAFLCFGTLTQPAMKIAEKYDLTVVDMRFVKPLDTQILKEISQTHQAIITLEDGSVMGGAGSACLEFFSYTNIQIPTIILGIPDRFIEQGDPSLLMAKLGLDEDGIEKTLKERFGFLLA